MALTPVGNAPAVLQQVNQAAQLQEAPVSAAVSQTAQQADQQAERAVEAQDTRREIQTEVTQDVLQAIDEAEQAGVDGSDEGRGSFVDISA